MPKDKQVIEQYLFSKGQLSFNIQNDEKYLKLQLYFNALTALYLVIETKDKELASMYSLKQREYVENVIRKFADLWNAEGNDDDEDGNDIDPVKKMKEIDEKIATLLHY